MNQVVCCFIMLVDMYIFSRHWHGHWHTTCVERLEEMPSIELETTYVICQRKTRH